MAEPSPVTFHCLNWRAGGRGTRRNTPVRGRALHPWRAWHIARKEQGQRLLIQRAHIAPCEMCTSPIEPWRPHRRPNRQPLLKWSLQSKRGGSGRTAEQP